MRVLRHVMGGRKPAQSDMSVDLIRTGMDGWTTAGLAALIQAGEIPQRWVDQTVEIVHNNPQLLSIEKDQFVRAVSVARPDLAPLLETTDGDAWLEKAMWRLGQSIILNPLRGLFKW